MPVQLDLVFEHQSESDPWMPVRFFCHTGAIWNAVRQEQEIRSRRRKKEHRPPARVPLVLSIVLYNGSRPWTAPRELWEVIEGASVFLEHGLLPTLPILFDDLAVLTDEEIRARPQSAAVRLALLLLKHTRGGDAVRVLQQERELVRRTAKEDPEVLSEGVRYALEANASSSEGDVRRALRRQLGRRGEEIVMTAGERLRAEGRVEGEAKTIVRFLQVRGLRVPADVRAEIEGCTDRRRLSRWIAKAATATTAREVVAKTSPRTRPSARRSVPAKSRRS